MSIRSCTGPLIVLDDVPSASGLIVEVVALPDRKHSSPHRELMTQELPDLPGRREGAPINGDAPSQVLGILDPAFNVQAKVDSPHSDPYPPLMFSHQFAAPRTAPPASPAPAQPVLHVKPIFLPDTFSAVSRFRPLTPVLTGNAQQEPQCKIHQPPCSSRCLCVCDGIRCSLACSLACMPRTAMSVRNLCGSHRIWCSSRISSGVLLPLRRVLLKIKSYRMWCRRDQTKAHGIPICNAVPHKHCRHISHHFAKAIQGAPAFVMVTTAARREHIVQSVASLLRPSIDWDDVVNLHICKFQFTPAIGAMSARFFEHCNAFISA